jgi:hypothetical protein
MLRCGSYLNLQAAIGRVRHWIFPRGLDWVSAGVTKIGFSDHNAVWVRFGMPD